MNFHQFINRFLSLILLIVFSSLSAKEPLTPSNVLKNSSADDWRTPNQNNLLHLQLESGEVIFELATDFTPQHIENIRKLIAIKYFDDLAIIRSHDNYVAQWGDPNAETDKAKSQGNAKKELDMEFFKALKDIEFTKIISRDAYADSVGFSKGFAVAMDSDKAWLTHCYGSLGVGRGMAANSGNAAELYVVTGHSPRHLDRNVTLIGRAISGIELLSSLPRGTGSLGFYETPEEAVTINAIRLGSELSEADQSNFEILRTDTETFNKYVQSRTTRLHEWFLEQTGKIEVCNVGIPIREKS